MLHIRRHGCCFHITHLSTVHNHNCRSVQYTVVAILKPSRRIVSLTMHGSLKTCRRPVGVIIWQSSVYVAFSVPSTPAQVPPWRQYKKNSKWMPEKWPVSGFLRGTRIRMTTNKWKLFLVSDFQLNSTNGISIAQMMNTLGVMRRQNPYCRQTMSLFRRKENTYCIIYTEHNQKTQTSFMYILFSKEAS